jgi:probable F420-dependent oxidoreductase
VQQLADDEIVWGIQLPIQSQSEIYVEDWERTAGPDELATVAKACEAAGAWYVAVCDHVAIPDDKVAAMGSTWYDTIATLGYLAALTERVRLISHVWVAAYRHPLVSANSFASLDRLSDGRVIIGVGAGHVEGEFEALGVDFHRRGKLLNEAIDQMAEALSAPSIGGLQVAPRPVQTPRPPIWIGGSAPAAIRRAAERGDGWLPQGTPKRDMPDAIADLRRLRDEAGRHGPFAIGSIAGPVHVGTPEWDAGPCIKGTPERIASYLRDYREMGVQHLQVRMVSRDVHEQCDQLRAFGEQVWPLVTAD